MIGYYIIDLDHQFTTPGWILQALLNRFTINEIWRMLAQRLPPCPKQWEGGSSGKICGQIFFPKRSKKLLAPSKHKTPHFFLGGKFRPALLWYAKGAFWYCQTSERFWSPVRKLHFESTTAFNQLLFSRRRAWMWTSTDFLAFCVHWPVHHHILWVILGTGTNNDWMILYGRCIQFLTCCFFAIVGRYGSKFPAIFV